jgi:hypothetical protein
MKTNLIYTASAAARILGVALSQVPVVLQEWALVVWVHVRGKRPRFMSKAAFKAEFVKFRRNASNALRVEKRHNNRYMVKNPKTNSQYGVTTGAASIVCDCPDYQKQVDAIGRGVCKHGYAVLNHLGHSTLAEYIAATYQPPVNPIPVRTPYTFVRVGNYTITM